MNPWSACASVFLPFVLVSVIGCRGAAEPSKPDHGLVRHEAGWVVPGALEVRLVGERALVLRRIEPRDAYELVLVDFTDGSVAPSPRLEIPRRGRPPAFDVEDGRVVLQVGDPTLISSPHSISIGPWSSRIRILAMASSLLVSSLRSPRS